MPPPIFNRKSNPQSPRSIAVLVGLTMAFSGCSLFESKDKTAQIEVNIPPTNTRALLLEFLQKQLFDPTSVRDAYITEPRLQPIGVDSRYVVCVRYNAKDGLGQYVGSRDFIAIYFAGKLNQYIAATPEQCASAPYTRFPELETLKKTAT